MSLSMTSTARAAAAALALTVAGAVPAAAQADRWEFSTAGGGVEAFAGFDGFPEFNMAFTCVAPDAGFDRRASDAPIVNRAGTYNVFIGRDGFLSDRLADGSSVRVRFSVDGRNVSIISFTALEDGGDLLGVVDADGALIDAVRRGRRLEAEAIGFSGFGDAPLRGSSRALDELAVFCGVDAAADDEDLDEDGLDDDGPSLGDLLAGRLGGRDREPEIATPPVFDQADDDADDDLLGGRRFDGPLAPGGLSQATVILTNRFGQSVRDDPVLDFRTGLARYAWSRGGRTLEVFFAREGRDRIEVRGQFRTRRGEVVRFSETLTRRRGGFFRFARDLRLEGGRPLFVQIELD